MPKPRPNSIAVTAQVEISKVTAAAVSIRDFFVTRKDDLLTKIRNQAKLTPELEAEIKTACEEWAASQA